MAKPVKKQSKVERISAAAVPSIPSPSAQNTQMEYEATSDSSSTEDDGSRKLPGDDDNNDNDDDETEVEVIDDGDDAKQPSTPPRNRKPPSAGTVGSLNKSYAQLIQEAIIALQDRTGSSQPAIAKWILQTYTDFRDGAQFRRNLNTALKLGVQKEHFTKIKASYKMGSTFKAKERARKKKAALAEAKRKKLQQEKAKEAAKQNSESNRAVSAEKAKQAKEKNLTAEETERLKAELEKKEEAARRRAEAEAKAKERAERIRKRRFPMEDTKLHAEDKELGVKPPPDVIARPYLPYFWQVVLPFGDPSRSGKTASSTLQASKVDALDVGSFGLVPDLLQVYHFFRGDVHFTGPNEKEYHPIVPNFTLRNLIFAVDQVVNGNARKSKMVPPLLCHLFVTCMQILFLPPDDSIANKHERKFRQDLHDHLAPALSPASWSEICCLYMDAMDRFYTTDASRDTNLLPFSEIDLEYLFGRQDQPVLPTTPGKKDDAEDTVSASLPERYHGYLGDPKGVLARAQLKLVRQDAWMLTAEELMSLLRALTDDVLATNKAIAEDIAAREEEMQELLRAKRSADNNFRKVRLAFEGPKRHKKPTGATDDKKTPADEKGNDEDQEEKNDGHVKATDGEEVFKPTATKKQFEAATKAQQKASEAYEKGIRKLVARTEPVGHDRNLNALYCFRHDPEILYIEDLRPPTGTASSLPVEMHFERRSWHVIETTSLFDQFVASLDIRGKREGELYDELLGPPSSQQSLRRYLHDDVMEQSVANSRLKEMEALKSRLEIARVKCNEEKGRRSGRLAGQAELELSAVESEIRALEMKLSGEKKEPLERDYAELTGLEELRRFEKAGTMDQRRSREVKLTKARYVPVMNCSDLYHTGNIDGTGIVGMIVRDLLDVEELCESLIPWERSDLTRIAWISGVESAVQAWNGICLDFLGPPPETPRKAGKVDSVEWAEDMRSMSDNKNDSGTSAKRRKLDAYVYQSDTGALSTASIITLLKQPLIDLEARVADITNLVVAARDVDLADDNMSVDGPDDDQGRLELLWKRYVHRIRNTPTKQYSQIRELLVSAITAARKAHRPDVVGQLRAALLLHHPCAAGECKTAAVKVLVSFGDYEEEQNDDFVADDEGLKDEAVEKEDVPSVIAMEAAVLKWADDSSRGEWINAVKSVKTVSRLAALTTGLCRKATEKLKKITEERDALDVAIGIWGKADSDRKIKATGKAKSKALDEPSEVWANVTFTDEICMAKIDPYPWWPAKKCVAKDPRIATALSDVDRSIVSLVGEMGGLRLVKNDLIKPFGEAIKEENSSDVSKETRAQLHDCIAMARRILRGRQKENKHS